MSERYALEAHAAFYRRRYRQGGEVRPYFADSRPACRIVADLRERYAADRIDARQFEACLDAVVARALAWGEEF